MNPTSSSPIEEEEEEEILSLYVAPGQTSASCRDIFHYRPVASNDDLIYVQSDVYLICEWVRSRNLRFKYRQNEVYYDFMDKATL